MSSGQEIDILNMADAKEGTPVEGEVDKSTSTQIHVNISTVERRATPEVYCRTHATNCHDV